MHVIRLPSLPYVSVMFISEGALVAAGHDCQPMVFEGSAENGWRITRSLDTVGTAASKPKPPPPPPKKPGLGGAPAPSSAGVGRLNNEAFARFREADTRGTSAMPSAQSTETPHSFGAVAGASIADDGELHTTHQNTITDIRIYSGQRGQVETISTSGVDGRLCTFETGKGSTAIAPILRGIASMRM